MKTITLGIAQNLMKDSHFLEHMQSMKGSTLGEVFEAYSKEHPDKAETLYNMEVTPIPTQRVIESSITDTPSKIKFDITPAPKGFKLKTEGYIKVESREDGGQALICESFKINTANSDDENGMFIILQSWDEDTVHTDLNSLIGTKVRLTIEVL